MKILPIIIGLFIGLSGHELTAQDSQSYVELDQFLSFSDAYKCQPNNEFDAFLSGSMFEGENGIVHLDPPVVPDRFRTYFGETSFRIFKVNISQKLRFVAHG
jgi:hypothetical protein